MRVTRQKALQCRRDYLERWLRWYASKRYDAEELTADLDVITKAQLIDRLSLIGAVWERYGSLAGMY